MKIKVKENSEERLLIYMAPGKVGLIGGAVVFFLMGSIAIWILAVRATLQIDSNKIEYRKEVCGFLLAKNYDLPRTSVVNSELGLSEVGISRTYKVALKTEAESLFLDFPKLDGDEKKAMVIKLNEVLLDPDGRYFYEESMIIPGLLLGGSSILGGLFCLFCLQTVTFLADRHEGVIQIMKRRILFPVSRKSVIQLSEFKRVKEKKVAVNRGGVEAVSYNLLLEHEAGEPISIAFGPMFTKTSSQEMRNLINRWRKRRRA